MRYALCSENHPVNNKGISVYKNFQQRKKNNLNNHKQHFNHNYKSNNLQESHLRNFPTYNLPLDQSQTYAQETQRQSSQSDTSPPATDINVLISGVFLDEIHGHIMYEFVALRTKCYAYEIKYSID
jgi:hypothetical protein